MKVRQSYDVERDTSKDLNKSEILILKYWGNGREVPYQQC